MPKGRSDYLSTEYSLGCNFMIAEGDDCIIALILQ